jgi:hypothetical protein
MSLNDLGFSASSPPSPRAPPLDLRRVAGRLERAALAVGQVEVAQRSHLLAPAWRHRERIAAAVRCMGADGLHVDPDRLLGLLAGLPLSGLRDEGNTVRAATLLQAIQRSEGEEAPPALAEPLAAMEGQGDELPALLSAALGLHRWMLDGGGGGGGSRGAGHAAVPLYLSRRRVTSTPFPALAAASLRLPGHPADLSATEFAAAFLDAVERDAIAALGTLSALAAAWRRWRSRIGPHRAHSRLPHLVDLAAAVPMLTAAQVAPLLGCAVWSASRLLAAMADAGVLVETTGRGNYKVYVTEDRATVRAVVVAPRRRGRRAPPPAMAAAPVVIEEAAGAVAWPPPPLEIAPRDERPSAEPSPSFDLSALLAETDAAIRKAQTAIERLSRPSQPESGPQAVLPCGRPDPGSGRR